MEIKVGEYIRTKSGGIGKVTAILRDEYVFTESVLPYELKKIKKHSPNIIDLIEVGDIIRVEGLKHAKEVIEDKFYRYDVFGNDVRAIIDDSGYGNYSKQIKDYKILSVVTHEQFEEMEYKV